MTDPLHIPNDPVACRALIVELTKQVEQQRQEIAEQQLVINELLQRAFQRRSERYIENPNQLKLEFGDRPEIADAADGLADAVAQAAEPSDEITVPEHTRRKRVPRESRQEQLPAHLPRYEVEAPVPDSVKHCSTHGEKRLIGHDRL